MALIGVCRNNIRFARQNEAARAADASACIDTSVGTAPLEQRMAPEVG